MKSKIKIIIGLAVGAALLLFGIKIQAQVAFGKDNVTNNNVLLEFGTGNKGIILPSVLSAPGATGGTFVFNTTTKAIEVYEGKNNSNAGGWTKLTDENQGVAHNYLNTGTADISGIAGVIIGSGSTTKPGTLVLESSTKALVLPYVANPHSAIKGAIAGTMVYDTTANMLAVFNGTNWSYWK